MMASLWKFNFLATNGNLIDLILLKFFETIMCFVFRLIIIIFLWCNFLEASLFDSERTAWTLDSFRNRRTRNALSGAFGRGSAFTKRTCATIGGCASKVSGRGGDVKTAITRDCTKSINGGVGFSAVVATEGWSFGARSQWIDSIVTSLSHTSVGSATIVAFDATHGKTKCSTIISDSPTSPTKT